MEQSETIYSEEKVIIIKPIKARIFSEDYERFENYDENHNKIILFKEKEK